MTEETEHYWQGGAAGELRFLRCPDCAVYIHPPSPLCPECLGKKSVPAAVSGKGVVHTFTVNHQPWVPGFDPPYVVAIIELDEQPGLRVTTNIVNCAIEDVEIGLGVRVLFEPLDDDGVFLPLFEPDPDRPTGNAGSDTGSNNGEGR